MKRIRITMELLDGSGAGEVVHRHERICQIREGTPARPLMLSGGRLLSQHYMLCDLDRFWDEIVMLGLLDEYVREWHMPFLPGGE